MKLIEIALCLVLGFYSCSKIQTISVREKGKLIQRYQVIRKSKVQDGYEKFYFKNGKIDGEFLYKDGQLNGAFVYYDKETGNIKQKGEFKEGKIEGILYTYYSNGELKEEVMHVRGLTEGAFKEFSEQGIVLAEGQYTYDKDQIEDLEQGLLKLYNNKGILIKKMICRRGQCCTIWTLDDGAVEPSSKLCEEIVETQR
jgi:antitoxin component YwqK of YwqJK toxin-antitoxin module